MNADEQQAEFMSWKIAPARLNATQAAWYLGFEQHEIAMLVGEGLVNENRLLRNQIRGRLRLTDPERISLADIGRRLGRKALAEVAQIVRPETILGWHRKLIARKFDGSKHRSTANRDGAGEAIKDLVLRFARENRTWGYRRIVGALRNLGHEVSHQTVGNVLKRHGLAPAPERQKKLSWREFIRSHTEVLAAVDFFTTEVWTAGGLITYYVLTFMRVASRQVHIAGITTSPDSGWMQQMARNVTEADTGFLSGCRYLLRDRDTKSKSQPMKTATKSTSPKRKSIDWKVQRKREAYYLKHGRFPTQQEFDASRKPRLMFGFNTVSR